MLLNSKMAFFSLLDKGYSKEEMDDITEAYFLDVRKLVSELDHTILDRKSKFNKWSEAIPRPTCRGGNCD